MWLGSVFRRPELWLPSSGKQGVRCGLNTMYGCHLSTSVLDCYYHKWNLWFLYRLEDPCFLYSFLQNIFSQSFSGHCGMGKKILRSWFPNQFAKLQPVQKKTQMFLNPQCLDNTANWATTLQSQNAKSPHEEETTWSKITILVPCTWSCRPEFDEAVLSTLEAVPWHFP